MNSVFVYVTLVIIPIHVGTNCDSCEKKIYKKSDQSHLIRCNSLIKLDVLFYYEHCNLATEQYPVWLKDLQLHKFVKKNIFYTQDLELYLKILHTIFQEHII